MHNNKLLFLVFENMKCFSSMTFDAIYKYISDKYMYVHIVNESVKKMVC